MDPAVARTKSTAAGRSVYPHLLRVSVACDTSTFCFIDSLCRVEDNEALPASLARWRPVPAVNLPNSITLTRIFSIPLLIWLLSTNHFHSL